MIIGERTLCCDLCKSVIPDEDESAHYDAFTNRPNDKACHTMCISCFATHGRRKDADRYVRRGDRYFINPRLN